MMLRIGNKLGFTLVEVMVTTAILSIGAVLIYETFFSSLDTFNYCSNYLNVAVWADQRVWQAKDRLSRFNSLAGLSKSGEFILDNRNYKWELVHSSIGAEGLHKIDLSLSWRGGRRLGKLVRSAYAIYKEKE